MNLNDKNAKRTLHKWPTCTKLFWPSSSRSGWWIRGQPVDGENTGPKLVTPGSKLFSTQPDGLYLSFGSGATYCDVVAIEVCGTVQNLNDKRSRYFPSSHSMVLQAKLGWLKAEVKVQKGGRKARWKVAGLKCPESDIEPPVRHLRVLYALPNDLYMKWCPGHVPSGYEHFCPHSALNSYSSQKMQSFLKSMSIETQFYLKRKLNAND